MLATFILTAVLASAPDACEPSPDAKRLTRPFPVGGQYLKGEDPQFEGPALASKLVNQLWSAKPPEPKAYSKLAETLWAEARAVLAEARKSGACPDCEAAAQAISAAPNWSTQTPTFVIPRRRPWQMDGFIAHFERGPFTWEITCENGEPDGHPDCDALLRRDGKLTFVYTPETYGEVIQELILPSGVLSIARGDCDLVTFDWRDGEYRPEPVRVAETKASTTLNNSRRYAPSLATDGDPRTAWCEGSVGAGEGESLELRWSTPTPVTTIAVLPGYAKSGDTFRQNARIRRARVTFSDGYSTELEFADAPALQFAPAYSRKTPWEDAWDALVTSVKLEILEVYPGTRFKDACLSELLLLSFP